MDSGTFAWAVTAGALVLFMTPGLAFFYGGLVKAKSVISMMMMSFGSIAVVGVLWVLYGFNMARSVTADRSPSPATRSRPSRSAASASPTLVLAFFGATFAIITVALVSGAIADRAKFGSWLIFAGLFATFVYFPVAAWVWGGGWIMNLGDITGLGVSVLDYAGGTAVHINAGAAALALALVLGKRIGFAKGAHQPHNPPFVLLGAAILWFGWFGFNGGAEAAWLYDGRKLRLPDARGTFLGTIVVNTLAAPAAALIGWIIVEKIKDGKATSIGAASGAVTGLVAITPACAFLEPGWAIVLGLIAGAISALAIELKFKLGFDDSLDVVGIHLVGGLVGTLFLGFFANGTGLLYSGSFAQLGVQAIAAFGVMIFSFVVAFIIAFVIEKTIGFRVKNEDEVAGIDTVVHGEEGYVLDAK